jgi:glutamine amidotransferase
VVIASEPMDEDPGWWLLPPGELLIVSADHRVTSHQVLDGPPTRELTLADLHPRAAASQVAA